MKKMIKIFRKISFDLKKIIEKWSKNEITLLIWAIREYASIYGISVEKFVFI